MNKTNKYTFSGHESFPCKALWLKKGFDFVVDGNKWSSPNSVVKLGVGKNMVASIRFWMKAFNLVENDNLTSIANLLLNDENGFDPYLEDLGTLWLLHYLLVSTGEATLYNLFFTRFQRERTLFERQQVVALVKRCMTEDNKLKGYNENTVKKDVAVLLQNYLRPYKSMSMEDYSALLIDLDLIRQTSDNKMFTFNIEGKAQLPLDILLYAILQEKGTDNTVDYDTLQTVGLMFCLTDMELIDMLMSLQAKYPQILRYTDTAGLRQVQLLHNITPYDVLNNYYNEKL
mgnify:CR=1 FL=1